MITCAAVGVIGFAKTVLFVVAWQLLAKRRSPAESVAKSDIAFSRPSAYPGSATIKDTRVARALRQRSNGPIVG
jgi:hypothetical protein